MIHCGLLFLAMWGPAQASCVGGMVVLALNPVGLASVSGRCPMAPAEMPLCPTRATANRRSMLTRITGWRASSGPLGGEVLAIEHLDFTLAPFRDRIPVYLNDAIAMVSSSKTSKTV